MRVLHLPSGSDIGLITKQLRQLGLDATSCTFSSSDIYAYRADIQLKLNELPPTRQKKELHQFFMKAMKEYDLFHFHFGKTFNSKNDLKILKAKGKKLIAHHRGSEVRKLSIAKKNNPFIVVKPEWTEDLIEKYVGRLSKYIDHCIVPDYELKEYVEPYYKHVHVVPRAIDVSKYIPNYPKAGTKPTIVHAPSNPEIKGTKYVLAAVNKLKKEGLNFEFKLVQGLSHQEAQKVYQDATIIVDQLCIGSFANLAMEGMALGKPVVCYIRGDLVNTYPHDLPIVNANPDSLFDVLKMLIQQPEQWEKIGRQGRAYVEKYHHVPKAAQQLIQIYKKL